MDTTPFPGSDPDQYAGTTNAEDANPQAGSGEDPIGGTDAVTGDRLDDEHSGPDDLEADHAPSAPVVDSGMPKRGAEGPA